MSSSRSIKADRPILIVTAGGLENGGGIGRMVGYMLAAWNDEERPRIKVIDTRGPKFTRIVWPAFFLNSIFQIVRCVPRRPLLHIHLAANGSTLRKMIVVYLGRLFQLDYVIHLHDPVYATFYKGLPRWMRLLVRSMFLGAGRVIVLGNATAVMVAELLEVPSERIDIVPNAVPGPANLVRGNNDEEEAEPHILFLGQLQPRKGVHDLIAALARPEVADLQWTTTLAGGGPDQAGYEKQAAQAGLRHRISFPGWLTRRATRSLLETSAILVLPSYAEEMAMSVLEGMAFGLCIVCTPVGALAEVVEDGVSALVVSPGDIQGLAVALARCITDPELRRRLGRNARDAYLRRYNVADYQKRIEAVYQRLTGASDRTAATSRRPADA
jgi:glycosyltransferase involved in cell wall biosynthesis